MNAMIKHIEENMQRDIEILIKDNKRRQENVSNAIAHLKCHINYYMYKTADLESQHRHDEILTAVCAKFNILSVDRHYISKELLKFRVLRIQHVLAILLIISIIFLYFILLLYWRTRNSFSCYRIDNIYTYSFSYLQHD